MKEEDGRFWFGAMTVIVVIGIVVFAATYMIRSWQIEQLNSSMRAAVDIVEEPEPIDISTIMVGYEGATYTLDEFVELDEIPVIVDVLIMQDDGTGSMKQAYVSLGVDDSDTIQYIDGVYGRLILPEKYSGKVADSYAG